MKRMYVVLAIILVVLVGMVSAISQIITPAPQEPQARQPFDRMKRRMELREEMHRRIREKLLNGNGPDQDLFKDLEADFEATMSDSLLDVDAFGGGGGMQNFKFEWTQTKEGRVLALTPQNPDQKINVDVNASVITIKGDSVQKTATSQITSSFTNSFPVPDDCDGTKVKMNSKDGKLLVELPYKVAKTVQVPTKEERKPLPPSAGDVEI